MKEGKELEIYNLDLDFSASGLSGVSSVEKLFQGPIGKLIIGTDESIILYDVNTKKIINQISTTSEYQHLKFVSWNANKNFVAIVCKKNIHIMTK